MNHRHDVVIRRTQYDLRKAEERAHILQGLIIASDNIDEVVHIIRSAQNPQAAIEGLMNRFELDEVQAKAIVEYRRKHGLLKSLKPLALYEEFTPDDLERLSHYLSFE